MSAVEEIQAAIDKLTELREACTPGAWSVTHGEVGTAIEWERGDSVSSPYVALLADEDGDDFNPDPGGSDNDAYLIVTLHRTIDAQMTILTDFMERYSMRRDTDWEPIAPSARNALNLARAINGGTQ